MAATITADDLARRFLSEVGADPNNAALRRAVRVWKSSEGQSICGNNPWFIRATTFHKNRDGSNAQRLCINKATRACTDDINAPGDLDCNFSKFKTLDDGIWATAQVLKFPRYSKVVAALRAGNAIQFLRELGASGWAAGGYNNALVKRYGNGLNAYQWTLSFTAGSSDVVVGGVNAAGDVAKSLRAWLKDHNISESDPMTADQLKAYMLSIGISSTAVDSAVGAVDDAGFIGKPWSVVLSKPDVLRSLVGPITDAKQPPVPVDWLGNIGKAFGFFLDVQNIGYMLALLVGGGLALYGFAHVAGVSAPSVPGPIELPTPEI
jgi:hypothetical protein